MSTEDDFEAYRREQLTQVRAIRVTDEGLQSFEKGLVRIIVRSEGSSQELKLNERELQTLAAAAGVYLVKKIPVPDLATLQQAITAAQERTVELAGADGTSRMDLQDAVMDELKAWQDYSKAQDMLIGAALATLTVRYEEATPAGVPVPLKTLTYAATALEGSADNGDRYAAQQIREAIAKHPSPEAYIAAQNAEPSPWEAVEPPFVVKSSWFDGHVAAGSHKPVQHRDGKAPWCPVCRMDAEGNVPKSRFEHEGRPTVTIRDSAGVPLYDVDAGFQQEDNGFDAEADKILFDKPLAEVLQERPPLDPKPYISNGVRYAMGYVSFPPEPPRFLPRPGYAQNIEAYPGAKLALDPRPWVNPSGGRVTAVFSQEQVDADMWRFEPRRGYEQNGEVYA
jgi:hypothetical protein